MKVTEKRRKINKLINEGKVMEHGAVSSRAKVIRNLNSDQCDSILLRMEIRYSDYQDILEKEAIATIPVSGGIAGGDGDKSQPEPSSDGESGDSKAEKPVQPDAIEKLADEILGDMKADEDAQLSGANFVTDKGMLSVTDTAQKLGMNQMKEIIVGHAKVLDSVISKVSKASPDAGPSTMEVKVGTISKPKTVEGVHHHPKFAEIVEKLQLNADQCVYLCGGAGAGKTTLAKQVSEAMELDFGFLSCTEGMSEAHLLGRMLFDGQYVESEFVRLYENGGVFLLDEMDAMDSNVAVVINSALANGHVSVPNRKDNPTALRHENFYVIGAGNTWGTGQGSNVYSGRNKLDTATLDRFWGIEFDYDKKLEKMLSVDSKMYKALNLLRKNVKSYSLNRVVGTRRFVDAGRIHANGKDVKYLLDHVTTGWTTEEINKVGLDDIMMTVEGK
tara:strand:- start:2740 stop:4074 length:1335 start_codon:yes stop_codon:yes gene_type:complete